MQESKRKGPKDEADGLAKRLQRINEALDEANKKAVNARSAAESAQKEADGLRPKYDELKVSRATCTSSSLRGVAPACSCMQSHAMMTENMLLMQQQVKNTQSSLSWAAPAVQPVMHSDEKQTSSKQTSSRNSVVGDVVAEQG
jgi:hypothetical protein